jgi:hypothetical protein
MYVYSDYISLESKQCLHQVGVIHAIFDKPPAWRVMLSRRRGWRSWLCRCHGDLAGARNLGGGSRTPPDVFPAANRHFTDFSGRMEAL